jgi:hypothetical protein
MAQFTTQLSRIFSSRAAQLKAIFMDNYEQLAPLYQRCFRMEPALNKGMFEKEDMVTGFGNLSRKGEHQEAATDRLYPGFQTTWTYVTYALMYEYSEDMLEADMDGIIAKAAKNLSTRAVDFIDSDFWNKIVNGFDTTTTGDGLYLFDRDHLTARGESQHNILSTAVDLSYGNLQLLMNLIKKRTDHSGYNYLNLPVKQLWVPVELEWKAMEIFPAAGGSIYRPHDVNLTTNVVNQAYSGIEIIVTPKITDDDMFVLSSGKELNEVKGKMYRDIRMQQEDKDKSKVTYEMIVDVRYDIQAFCWIPLTASPGA